MSVVEQRYRAVLAVQAGETAGVVAAQFGVSRQSVQNWLRRYRDDGLAGLVDQPKRPVSSPGQTSAEVEALICEMRREHPRWGARRLVHELERQGVVAVPSRVTVHRVLVRHGLIQQRPRRRPRSDYRRWERDAPMALWQLDIVGGVMIDTSDGVGGGGLVEAKVVTGIDDHSRFCVIASVVPRATGRAVCLAFAEALARFGVPEEVLTDNGKQFTARFGRGGEVLFDRICRDNAIIHRLTQPASPTTTGKVERFHQSLRRELLDDHEPFGSLLAAQAAIESWVTDYNCTRPHQALDMACPADRFSPSQTSEQRARQALLPLRLPPTLTSTPPPITPLPSGPPPAASDAQRPPEPELSKPERTEQWTGGPVEFDRVVPPSGNLGVAGKQFWLGPERAGVTVTFWADEQVIHLRIAGARVKTVRSHLSSTDLAALAGNGGRPAGPSPIPPPEPEGTALEVDRTISGAGLVSLGPATVLAAEILGGRRVSIRIDRTLLSFFDPETRELLRTRPNPLSWDQARKLRGARPAGPPPRPRTEPITVQRRASNTGVIMIAGQNIALGRSYAHRILTAHVSETTVTVELDGDTRTIARTTTRPVRRIKADRPRKSHVS
jgi:transposase InsO family protein